MGYRAVVLPVFGAFVLSRRLESVLGYIEKNDTGRAHGMLKEAYENLGKAEHTDIVGHHMETVSSGIAVALSALESGDSNIQGHVEGTLLYIHGLIAGLAESYDVIINRPQGPMARLPAKVRRAIANEAF